MDDDALDFDDEVEDKTLRNRLRMLDWRRVRQFLFVYERRSIGQAAAELNVTQPALSKSLRSLENDLEVRLFERTPLGVVPTVFGEALALHAKAIQAELRSAFTQIQYMRGATRGHVVVGMGPSLAANVLPTASIRLLAERPGIKLTVREGLADELVPALRRGEIDLAIGTWAQTNDPDLAVEIIHRDSLRVYAGAGHPLLGRQRSLADLLDYPWALPPQSQTWRKRLDEIFIARGLPPLVAGVESNSSTYLKAVLSGNTFLSFLPRLSMVREEQLGLVRPLDTPDLVLDSDVTVTYRERAVMSPAARMLLAHLRTVAEELNESGEAQREVADADLASAGV